jgi:hypothetical protein
MSTNCTFLCGLHGLTVDFDLKEGILLTPNEQGNPTIPSIRITNNKGMIKKFLNNQFVEYVGLVESNHLLNGYPLIAYAENKCNLKDSTSLAHLDKHLYFLKMYFFCLWLIKDNAGDFDIGFLSFNNQLNDLEVCCNNYTSINFRADGTRNFTLFSMEELESACSLLQNSVYIDSFDNQKVASSSKNNRITIASYFIQQARISADLGIKTANYCAALESLFVNDNAELSHKLSERVSRYLAKELTERKSIYRLVKKAYEMRSKVVHGASFKISKIPELVSITCQSDDLCRRLMRDILECDYDSCIFTKSQDDIEEFFLDLILS